MCPDVALPLVMLIFRLSLLPFLQAELQRRLESEHKRAHLDMRHRLDKDGNRYGKILDYK